MQENRWKKFSGGEREEDLKKKIKQKEPIKRASMSRDQDTWNKITKRAKKASWRAAEGEVEVGESAMSWKKRRRRKSWRLKLRLWALPKKEGRWQKTRWEKV